MDGLLFRTDGRGESGGALPVSVTFSFRGLGTNSDVPELAAAGEAFASFTQADLLYAQMEWALGEDSALFDGVLTAAGQQAVSFDAHLHEGEQLQQLTAGTEGGQGITAAVRRGEQFYSVRMYGRRAFRYGRFGAERGRCFDHVLVLLFPSGIFHAERWNGKCADADRYGESVVQLLR